MVVKTVGWVNAPIPVTAGSPAAASAAFSVDKNRVELEGLSASSLVAFICLNV